MEATADVFLTALRALPKAERDAVLVGIVGDKNLARDLLDLATIARRRHEPSRAAARRRPRRRLMADIPTPSGAQIVGRLLRPQKPGRKKKNGGK